MKREIEGTSMLASVSFFGSRHGGHRRACGAATFALAIAALLPFGNAGWAAPVDPNQNIATGLGSTTWRITNGGGTSVGQPFSGSCGGPALVIQDATSASGAGDAYDNAWEIFVNGAFFIAPSTVDLTGTTYTAGPVNMSGLDVTVQYHFFTDRQLGRTLAILRNPSGAAINATVQVPVNFGSDGNSRFNGSSSGDAVATVEDRWVVSSDGSPSDPVNTTVFYGPGQPPVTPTSYTQPVFDCAGPQGLGATFDFPVPAGETRVLMFFAGLGDIEGLGNTITGAVSNAAIFDNSVDFIDLGLLASFGAVLPSQVVNWRLQPALSIRDVILPEGNSGQTPFRFAVTLTSPGEDAVFVDYTTVPRTATNTGNDFVATSGTLEIPAGQTSATINVLVNGDLTPEGNEAFSVRLSSPVVAAILDGIGNGVIRNDDPPDSTPAAFTFRSVSGVPVGSLQKSAVTRITGINMPTPITVSGGSYSINGRAYTTAAGNILPNDLVSLSHTAAATPSTQTVTQVNIGGMLGTFTSTTVTADTRPDAFGFSSQSNVPLATLRESNVVRIGGINAPASLSVSGGASYRINGGTYVTAGGQVNAGDTVQLRLMSSATAGTRVSATLNVGGVSGVFSVTTAGSAP